MLSGNYCPATITYYRYSESDLLHRQIVMQGCVCLLLSALSFLMVASLQGRVSSIVFLFLFLRPRAPLLLASVSQKSSVSAILLICCAVMLLSLCLCALLLLASVVSVTLLLRRHAPLLVPVCSSSSRVSRQCEPVVAPSCSLLLLQSTPVVVIGVLLQTHAHSW
jgi:hypothetical protein